MSNPSWARLIYTLVLCVNMYAGFLVGRDDIPNYVIGLMGFFLTIADIVTYAAINYIWRDEDETNER